MAIPKFIRETSANARQKILVSYSFLSLSDLPESKDMTDPLQPPIHPILPQLKLDKHNPIWCYLQL